MRIVVQLALIGLLALSFQASAGQYNSVISIGDPMPAFEELPTVDGSTISSSDLEAPIVILVALANHCPWSRGADPAIIQLVEDYENQGVRLVGFSVNHREDDRMPAMKKHAAAEGYNFTYLYDESQDIGRDLGATRTPEFFIFNQDRELVYTGLLHDSPPMERDGNIRNMNGEPSEFYVRQALDALLADEPVPVAETKPHGCNVVYEQDS